MTTRLLKLKDVLQITGVSKSALYQLVKAGRFPAPHRLNAGRLVRWSTAEVDAWLDDLVKARDAAA